MILTIDLNPSIDRTYIVDGISKNSENKAESSVYASGGSGIIVAKLLNVFNESTFITGFLGGITGEFYYRELVNRGIIHKVINIKDDTRTNIEIVSKVNDKLTILEKGPRITRDDIVGFYELYDKLLNKIDVIIGGSSLPIGVDTDIYFNLINISNRKDKYFILDATGEELFKGIEAAPYAVVVSKGELENLINLELNFEHEIIKVSSYVLDKGIKILIVNLHEEGIMVLERSKGYRLKFSNQDIDIDKIDNTGIVVGLALGIIRNYDIEMTFKLSQAFGLAYSLEKDINILEMSDVKRIMGQIDIYPINF